MTKAGGSQISAPQETDATSLSLLMRLKARDAAAWNRLVMLYAPLVHYWCHRLDLPDQDAADVLQEVFQAVSSHIASFRKERPDDSFRGWLRVITHNKVYDYFRRTGREAQAVGGTEANLRLAQLPALEETVDEDGAERQVHRRVIHRALELIRCEFTSRTWQAFWRVVVDGQRAPDVADELDMRPGAVRVAKSRVLRRLRQELGESLE
jgi:RNA polymerase sigma-70 factor (ECF subfamily)